MPVPFTVVKSSSVSSDTALTAATEAVIATVSGVSPSSADQTVSLLARASVLTQAGGTTVTLRLRRVSLTGTLVGEGNPHQIGASLSAEVTDSFDDQPGDVAGLTYVLTAVSAVGNATATDAWIMAAIHS